MKISIITISLNSEKTILYTLNSVRSQTYKRIEHIIVDGGSIDKTLPLIKKEKLKNLKLFIKKKSSIYEALNFGIKKATGKWILILHSNDILNDPNVIYRTTLNLKNEDTIYYGDVIYFRKKNFHKIFRIYTYPNYNNSMIFKGIIPPHTGSFISKKTYKTVGEYGEFYKIAGDFDFFARVTNMKKIKFKYLNLIISRMLTGGISGLNLRSYYVSTLEIIKALIINKGKYNLLKIILRIPIKINQLIFLKINKNLYDFKYKYITSRDSYDDLPFFKLLKKTQYINFNKNFILSALNLAFLGSFVKKRISYHRNIICWPDGIFSWTVSKNIKKIPGRDIIKKIIIPKTIKKILVLGNLSSVGKKYLESKLRRPVIHKLLPYGNINHIFLKIKNLKIKKSYLTFLTIPTPKQEEIAIKLAKKNKNYKIICIGGSIAMACGDEAIVPKVFTNFEFVWRLRYETGRRILRLLTTLYYYAKGRFITMDLKNIRFDVIESKK